MAVVLDASGDPPPAAAIDRAAAALAAGAVVVIPTDTVYGLAVDPRHPGATDRLFAAKQRPRDTALPVLVASVEQALTLAAEDLPAAARRLMARHWPGGLTVVVRRRPGLDLTLGGDEATVGLRLPAAPVPVALAVAAGPLAVTSANLHGMVTPATVGEVLEQLDGGRRLDLLALDAGPCRGAPSTVVACTDGEARVLREGALPAARIAELSP